MPKEDEHVICNFCSKPHKNSEVKKIKVTYIKCNDCEEGDIDELENIYQTARLMSGTANIPHIQQGTNMNKQVSKVLPPPMVAGAMRPPEGMGL